MLHVYAWRARKQPVLKQRLYSSDINYHFADILEIDANRSSPSQEPCCPEDLFSDELLEVVLQDNNSQQQNKSSSIDDVCIVSPTICLKVRINDDELPEVNQQVDSEIYRSLTVSNKP